MSSYYGEAVKYRYFKKRNLETIAKILHIAQRYFTSFSWNNETREDFIYSCLFRNEFKMGYDNGNRVINDAELALVPDFVDEVNEVIQSTPNEFTSPFHSGYLIFWL